MNREKRNNKNNKGITLVELLIAIAIGSIVISAVIILLKQGINSYSKQTITAQLQNDADITLNQMTDAIMEAKYIDIYNVMSVSGNTPNFVTEKAEGVNAGNAYSYQNQVLYVGTTPAISNAANCDILCKNVESFKIHILTSSVKIEKITGSSGGLPTEKYKITGVNNPVQIKVSLKLYYKGVTREVSRVTALRNDIDLLKLKIQGSQMDEFDNKAALDEYFTD